MEEQTTVYATNRFVPTLDHYRQAYSEMLKRSTLLFAGAVALMAAIFAVSVLLSDKPLFSTGNIFPLAALGVAAIIVAVQAVLMPGIYANTAMKRMTEAFGGPGALTTKIVTGGITVHNAANDNLNAMPFVSFTRFTETRDLLLLRTNARQTVMVAKTGFEDGCTEAEFKTLMQQNCPNAKAKWRN